MTTPARNDDAVLPSILHLKRQLTDLKMDALLLEPKKAHSAASIHDVDAIVAEVVEGVEERRHTRPPMSDAQSDGAGMSRVPDSLRTPTTRL